VALFGRKINNAENQLAFIHFLRLLADGEITAEDAVAAYHAVLQKLGIRPHRSFNDDMCLQTSVMRYAGTGKTISHPENTGHGTRPIDESKGCSCGCSDAGPTKKCATAAKTTTTDVAPDFSTMATSEKIAYHKARWDRVL